MWNERFTVKAANEVDAHRPVGGTIRLESILSHMEMRQVTNDYTVAWEGGRWHKLRIGATPLNPPLHQEDYYKNAKKRDNVVDLAPFKPCEDVEGKLQ